MARWICKLCRDRGQVRVTIPKGLVEALKWEGVEVVEMVRLVGNTFMVRRFAGGKGKREQDKTD